MTGYNPRNLVVEHYRVHVLLCRQTFLLPTYMRRYSFIVRSENPLFLLRKFNSNDNPICTAVAKRMSGTQRCDVALVRYRDSHQRRETCSAVCRILQETLFIVYVECVSSGGAWAS